MDIESIADHHKKEIKKQIRENLKLSWCFDKFHEKAILVIITFLASWKVINLIF